MNPSGRGSSESETLLPQHHGGGGGDNRPIIGAGYASGARGENVCTGPIDTLDENPEHPIVSKIWSFGGLADIIALIALGMIGGRMKDAMPYHHDEIDPDDPAINYPYVKHSAYPSHRWNWSILIWIPISALVVVRLLEVIYPMLLHISALQRILPHPRYTMRQCPYMNQRRTGHTASASMSLVAKDVFVQMYRDIFAIVANAMFLYVVVETLKVWSGKLRPDFMDRCEWDKDHHRCTGDEKLIKEGMKGFPSGHAAYSVGSMLFIVQVLFHTFRPHMHSFLAMILCLSPLAWAGKISMTRYWENRHSAVELLAGMFVGLVISILSFRAFRAKSKDRHHRLCCAGESPVCY